MGQDDEFTFRPIHQVQLAVPKGGEDVCRAFWGGVLGMRELERPPARAARGGCWFRSGALARRLEDAGHPVTWDDDFPGHDRFYAADPFGNRLEFLQPSAG